MIVVFYVEDCMGPIQELSQSLRGLPTLLLITGRGTSLPGANISWFSGSAGLDRRIGPKSLNLVLFHVSPKCSNLHWWSRWISSYILELVSSLSMNVDGLPRILRSILFWKPLSLDISDVVNCMHSKLYRSLLRIIELNTCIFHFLEVFALFQNSPIRLHVPMQSPSLFATSALLSNVSVRRVPK